MNSALINLALGLYRGQSPLSPPINTDAENNPVVFIYNEGRGQPEDIASQPASQHSTSSKQTSKQSTL